MGCLKLEEKSSVLKVVYSSAGSLTTDTGHEHFFDNEIIHMNGRIYDPRLQTFLSPDINILDPMDSQHYNRYSYALNNPLLYTDPTGNVVAESVIVTAALVGAIFGAVSYVALTAYYGNAFTFDAFAKNVIIGAVSSAAFQFGLGLLKDVLFPALANTAGGYISTGGGDALIKMPNFLCEPCAEQAKNLKTLIWSGRIASGIGGGAGTALAQGSGVNVPPRGDLPWYKSYFDYNGDNKISNFEMGMGALDIGAMTFDIATIPSGESVAFHTALKLSAKTGIKQSVKTGVTILGHHPEYVNLASKLNAKRFNIPTKIWETMTDPQRWAANQKFLDRMISRGDKIRLATPLNKVKPGSYFQKELNYLFQKGYRTSSNGRWLIK